MLQCLLHSATKYLWNKTSGIGVPQEHNMCQQPRHAGNTGNTYIFYLCLVLTDLTPTFLHVLTYTLMPSHAAFYVFYFLLLKGKMKKESLQNVTRSRVWQSQIFNMWFWRECVTIQSIIVSSNFYTCNFLLFLTVLNNLF